MADGGVEAVERALLLLEAFGDDKAWLELREVAQRSGLNKATILRIAVSLERYGHLRRDARGRFALGPSLWRLGELYRRSFDIGDLVRPVLDQIVEASGETAAFYVHAGEKRLCLFRRNSPRAARHHVEEGDQLSLDQGSGGHLLRAFSDAEGERYEEIRRQGWCLSRGERDPDVSGVAAPVFGADGRLIGALLISGLNSRFEGSQAGRHRDLVVKMAAQLSESLGCREQSQKERK